MEQQLELPLDSIRIQNTEQLAAITLSRDQTRIDINDLLALSDILFERDANEFVIGSSDHTSHRLISELLVGRISEMNNLQKSRYRLMIGRLALILPPKKPSDTSMGDSAPYSRYAHRS